MTPTPLTPLPPPFTTPVDASEAYLVISMGFGLLVSCLLFFDAIRDRIAVREQPSHDPRRPLATGLFVLSIGYLILKTTVFYIALGLIYDLPSRGAMVRIGLAASFNIMDLCVGIFWYLRKKAL